MGVVRPRGGSGYRQSTCSVSVWRKGHWEPVAQEQFCFSPGISWAGFWNLGCFQLPDGGKSTKGFKPERREKRTAFPGGTANVPTPPGLPAPSPPFPADLHLSASSASPSLIRKPEGDSPHAQVSASGELWPGGLGQHLSAEGAHRNTPAPLPKAHQLAARRRGKSCCSASRSYLSYLFSGLRDAPGTRGRPMHPFDQSASGFYLQSPDSADSSAGTK